MPQIRLAEIYHLAEETKSIQKHVCGLWSKPEVAFLGMNRPVMKLVLPGTVAAGDPLIRAFASKHSSDGKIRCSPRRSFVRTSTSAPWSLGDESSPDAGGIFNSRFKA